jgi:hypothetical protein
MPRMFHAAHVRIKTVLDFFMLLVLSGMGMAADAPGFKVSKRYPVPGDCGFAARVAVEAFSAACEAF